jgi:DNA-binding NarL/FixJ family response regulator
MTPVLAERVLAVAIVEDKATIREGISLLIEAASGFRCAGSFNSMEQALPAIEESLPDVVLVDLALPGMSGVEGIRRLSARHPELPLLVFTVYEDDDRVVEALRSGACGCLSKKTPPQHLLECLRAVVDGGAAPTPPEAARCLLDLLKISDPPRGMGPPPPRELDLLSLLANGHNYETAAAVLGKSTREVLWLAREVYRRLHAAARDRGH